MPKNPIDFSKNIIYKIVCNDLTIKDCYVGHTTNFIKRKQSHKSACNNEKNKSYNLKIYTTIRLNGGFSNWSMIEVEKYPCLDFNEACARERFWYETLGAKMNSNVPNRSQKDYYETNKEVIAEKHKDYYEINKEVLAEKHKDYYETNKEVILEQTKDYNEKNKEVIAEYKKKHYEANKEVIAEYKKKHYEANKEVITLKKKIYNKNNKEHIAQHKKEWYENNKEHIAEKQKTNRQNKALLIL